MSTIEEETTKPIKEAGKRNISKSLAKEASKQSGLRQEIIKDILRYLRK